MPSSFCNDTAPPEIYTLSLHDALPISIIMKALAPDARQRYPSAAGFRADLQLFLERKPTLAETERRPRWNPNATLEAARACLRRVTRTARRRHARSLRPLGAAGYFPPRTVPSVGWT